MSITKRGWIGFDLDGTTAEHSDWKGPLVIGRAIPKMVERWKQHRAEGYECRIVTARVDDLRPDFTITYAVQNWAEENLGERPVVTNRKDYGMILLYDDRARQVIPNTGIVVGESDV